mmetsp:Transcript_3943/g.13001  ORF Transcript_3943/g.13001 Transcript_3943/m.13001 type:complete len:257 (-) Transcript_3943:1189-1959(-)
MCFAGVTPSASSSVCHGSIVALNLSSRVRQQGSVRRSSTAHRRSTAAAERLVPSRASARGLPAKWSICHRSRLHRCTAASSAAVPHSKRCLVSAGSGRPLRSGTCASIRVSSTRRAAAGGGGGKGGGGGGGKGDRRPCRRRRRRFCGGSCLLCGASSPYFLSVTAPGAAVAALAAREAKATGSGSAKAACHPSSLTQRSAGSLPRPSGKWPLYSPSPAAGSSRSSGGAARTSAEWRRAAARAALIRARSTSGEEST